MEPMMMWLEERWFAIFMICFGIVIVQCWTMWINTGTRGNRARQREERAHRRAAAAWYERELSGSVNTRRRRRIR